jgi:hypothetical protein
MFNLIVWDRADGGVTVEFLADESQLDRALALTGAYHEKEYGGAVPHIDIDPATLPGTDNDPIFRNAWEWKTDRVVVSMPKARLLHMTQIRTARNLELQALDGPYMRALEQGDEVEKGRIAAIKQGLRDIPQTFDLSIHDTPEALRAAWPTELP